MKPACRPISLTSPTPPTAEWASTIAALIDFAASVKEVTKPKLWPMNGMSLSIVFGMPITPIVSPRRSDGVGDLGRAAHRAVAADHEQQVDAERDQPVHHLVGVLRAARGAEHRAALSVDAVHDLRGQSDRLGSALDQPGVPGAEAGHLADPVVLGELHHQTRG